MTTYYHPDEHQACQAREQSLFSRLPTFIANAQRHSPYYQTLLADVNADSINSRAALAQLPITRKSDLITLQKRQPPLAGMNTSNGHVSRIFQSPGPIYDPESCHDDWFPCRRLCYR